jgi:hypothetical protein
MPTGSPRESDCDLRERVRTIKIRVTSARTRLSKLGSGLANQGRLTRAA